MAFILQDSDFSRLLDKRLTDVWEQSLKDLKPMRNQFFTVAKSDSAFEEFFYTTGLVGDTPEFNGALTYGALYPGFHKKIEHKEYAYALQAQRKLIDDKKWGVLDDRPRYLAEAYEGTRGTQAGRTSVLWSRMRWRITPMKSRGLRRSPIRPTTTSTRSTSVTRSFRTCVLTTRIPTISTSWISMRSRRTRCGSTGSRRSTKIQ